jgi:excisionase family DNA binding protein
MTRIDGLHLYDLPELCEKLNLHLSTAQRYCRTKRIPAVKVGRSWRVSDQNLKSFLNGNNVNNKKKEHCNGTSNKRRHF